MRGSTTAAVVPKQGPDALQQRPRPLRVWGFPSFFSTNVGGGSEGERGRYLVSIRIVQLIG